jgi:hypothetical protein
MGICRLGHFVNLGIGAAQGGAIVELVDVRRLATFDSDESAQRPSAAVHWNSPDPVAKKMAENAGNASRGAYPHIESVPENDESERRRSRPGCRKTRLRLR